MICAVSTATQPPVSPRHWASATPPSEFLSCPTRILIPAPPVSVLLLRSINPRSSHHHHNKTVVNTHDYLTIYTLSFIEPSKPHLEACRFLNPIMRKPSKPQGETFLLQGHTARQSADARSKSQLLWPFTLTLSFTRSLPWLKIVQAPTLKGQIYASPPHLKFHLCLLFVQAEMVSSP